MMKKIIALSVTLILLVGLGFGFAGPIEDQIRCRITGSAFDHGSFYVRVPRGQLEELSGAVEQFAEKNGLMFAMDRYPSGVADEGYLRTVLGACNREIDVFVANTFEEDVFVIVISRNDQVPSHEFEALNDEIVAEIVERFEPAENSEEPSE